MKDINLVSSKEWMKFIKDQYDFKLNPEVARQCIAFLSGLKEQFDDNTYFEMCISILSDYASLVDVMKIYAK